jgi:hypothetical protein
MYLVVEPELLHHLIITNILRSEFHLRSLLRYVQQRSVTCTYVN